jgi:transposase
MISAADAAARLGVARGDLESVARSWFLEPTYSLEEVATHFGLSKRKIAELVELGRRHGQALHPTRGGLYPTFKPSHKSRRIPLSAIERHKRHMARVHDGGVE